MKETEVELATAIDSCTLETAILVVEVFFFLFSIAGFKMKIPSGISRKVAIKIVQKGLQKRLMSIVKRLLGAIEINDFAKAAQYIVEILTLGFHEGIFSIIIDVLGKEMHWWEWILFAGAVVANMALWISTGFAVLMVKIITVLASAFSLIDQINKVVEECS